MAKISDSTFKPLLSYVNVRLQQGVPIVDADVNELDDVRKFELQAYLKWFVGDGVPEGNDGFRITGGLANDVMITIGVDAASGQMPDTEKALHHVGRLLVDGVDVIIDRNWLFSEQHLHESQADAAALAAALRVPVVRGLTTPTTDTTLVAYLDVWEHLVTADDVPDLLHTAIGTETCARTKRDWVVRVDEQVPLPNTEAHLAGHRYYPLARITRAAGQQVISVAAVRDLRERRLLTPPAHLLEDTVGAVDPLAYRRGAHRPATSLRTAVNALLVGELPSGPQVPVADGTARDKLGRAGLVDARGGLVVVWQSPRFGNTDQVVGARLDLAGGATSFSETVALTSGSGHRWPTAVPLPDGDILVAYQDGPFEAPGTKVRMKRAQWGDFDGLDGEVVAETTGAAHQSPLAVVAGEHVVIFSLMAFSDVTKNRWTYRRYNHVDRVFVDPTPKPLPRPHETGPDTGESVEVTDMHAASVGEAVFVAYVAGASLTVQLLEVDTGMVGDRFDTTLSTGDGNIAVMAGETTSIESGEVMAALVFYRSPEADGLQIIACPKEDITAGARDQVPGTDGLDSHPFAVRDPDGTVHLFTGRSRPGSGHDVQLRRREPVNGDWGRRPQRLSAGSGDDDNPLAVLVPGRGIWAVWEQKGSGSSVQLLARPVFSEI